MKVYDELLDAATGLDMLRRLEGGSINAHATAAMHGLRFAATILWPTVPGTPPPANATTANGCSSSSRTGARQHWN